MSEAVIAGPEVQAPSKPLTQVAMEVVRTEAFRFAVLVAVGIFACFWGLLKELPALWTFEDGYYSHGFLVPFISGYIVYRRWPMIKDIPVRPGWIAGLLLIPLLLVNRVVTITNIQFLLSVDLILVLLLGTWFAAGWRWMTALFFPIAYLIFCLPVWVSVIETYTNPLQQISTKVAFQILAVLGFQPMQVDSTSILVNSFMLDIAIPCSGLKLLLALTSFTIFFVLIANLRWWGNLVMLLTVIPLALFINGLRIALIGIVGDTMGSDAGHQFHDYSGYITLLLCFVVVFKLARILGWKD